MTDLKSLIEKFERRNMSEKIRKVIKNKKLRQFLMLAYAAPPPLSYKKFSKKHVINTGLKIVEKKKLTHE